MRRTASQFLLDISSMMSARYISPEDLFRIIPETGRLLAVLTPIEIAIQHYWAQQEPDSISGWDYPVTKFQFKELWKKCLKWHKKHHGLFKMDSVTWSKMSVEYGLNELTIPETQSGPSTLAKGEHIKD